MTSGTRYLAYTEMEHTYRTWSMFTEIVAYQYYGNSNIKGVHIVSLSVKR